MVQMVLARKVFRIKVVTRDVSRSTMHCRLLHKQHLYVANCDLA